MRPRMGAKFFSPRNMYLEKTLKEMQDLKKDSTIFDFTVEGDPPDKYHIVFHGKSLAPKGDKIGIVDRQAVDVQLGVEFPRIRPNIHWMTPILHPNISGGSVCLGNFAGWVGSFKLVDIIEVLWDYSRLAIMNPSHGYSRDLNWDTLRRKYEFPVDKRPLRDKILGPDDGSSVVRAEPSDRDDILFIEDDKGICEQP